MIYHLRVDHNISQTSDFLKQALIATKTSSRMPSEKLNAICFLKSFFLAKTTKWRKKPKENKCHVKFDLISQNLTKYCTKTVEKLEITWIIVNFFPHFYLISPGNGEKIISHSPFPSSSSYPGKDEVYIFLKLSSF